MNNKEMIKSNNAKRKELTEENRKYYEEMLLYIRLSYSKSEQETEEVLSEMLDHLIEAQKHGRTAEEVFGDDPKGYADEIIGELPAMMTKKRISLVITGLLGLFTGVALFGAIGDLILYLTGVQSNPGKTIFLGSFLLKAVIIIPLGFLFAYLLIRYMRWTTFRNTKRSIEFLRDSVFGGAAFGVLLLLYLGMFLVLPLFGPELQLPLYVNILAGLVLGVLTWVSVRKFNH